MESGGPSPSFGPGYLPSPRSAVHQGSDEHTSSEVDMSLAYHVSEDILDATHAEMSQIINDQPNLTQASLFEKHLNLTSPPNSPNLPSPEMLKAPNIALRSYLRRKIFAELLLSDRDAHRYMKDL